MTRILKMTTAVLGFCVATTPAFAGDLSQPVIAAAPAAPAPVQMQASADWSGFYAGGSLGYGEGSEPTTPLSLDGLTYGVHAGYDYDLGSFVLGGELEISGTDWSDGGVDVDSVARAKLRAGYDAGVYLPYLTAGVAQLTTSGAVAGDDTGAFYGLGMDYRMTNNIRVGGEVLHHEFDNFNATGLNIDATTAAVRLSFEF